MENISFDNDLFILVSKSTVSLIFMNISTSLQTDITPENLIFTHLL